jgi:hypothetical protein
MVPASRPLSNKSDRTVLPPVKFITVVTYKGGSTVLLLRSRGHWMFASKPPLPVACHVSWRTVCARPPATRLCLCAMTGLAAP